MKLTSVILIGALTVAGCTLAQAQQPPTLPEPPKPPSPPWAQKDPPPPACLEEAQRLCSGKQGPEAAECLKSNSDKLAGKCKAGTTK
jgi:hypothetical protein